MNCRDWEGWEKQRNGIGRGSDGMWIWRCASNVVHSWQIQKYHTQQWGLDFFFLFFFFSLLDHISFELRIGLHCACIIESSHFLVAINPHGYVSCRIWIPWCDLVRCRASCLLLSQYIYYYFLYFRQWVR